MNSNNEESLSSHAIPENPIKKLFKKDNSLYLLTISPNNQRTEVTLQIKEEFDSVCWKKTFNLQTLVKENLKWGCFDSTNDIVNLISKEIENIEIETCIQYFQLIFKLNYSCGRFDSTMNLELKLEPKEITIEESVKTLKYSVKKIKEIYLSRGKRKE